MRFFVAVVGLAAIGFVAGAGLTEEQVQKLRAIHKDCSASSGVSDELIAKARQGELVDDPKLKEHLFCVAKQIGFMNDAGDIQQGVLKAKLGAALGDEAAAERLVSQCAVKRDTPQDTAFECIKCYRDNTPTHIILV